jgi:hypothetical protein
VYRKVKRKRNRGLAILLLPALVFIGFMGWLLYSIEPNRKKSSKKQHTAPQTPKNDGVTFVPTLPEEEQEISLKENNQ